MPALKVTFCNIVPDQIIMATEWGIIHRGKISDLGEEMQNKFYYELLYRGHGNNNFVLTSRFLQNTLSRERTFWLANQACADFKIWTLEHLNGTT